MSLKPHPCQWCSALERVSRKRGIAVEGFSDLPLTLHPGVFSPFGSQTMSSKAAC